MKDYGLGDSWRMRDPFTQEYYFSSLHQSYLQISLFLICNSLAQDIHESTIDPITIRNHAPVSLAINIQSYTKPPTRWRFNTSLLQDPDFISLIAKELASFLEMNGSPGISPKGGKQARQ